MERSFAGAILAQKSGGADSDQHQVLIFPTQPALGYNVSGWAFAIFFFKDRVQLSSLYCCLISCLML